jgi:extracellular elastinolytic metalloproteinase
MTQRLPRIAIVSVLVVASALLAVPSPAQPAAPRPAMAPAAADGHRDARRAVASPGALAVAEAAARASLAGSLGRRGVFDLDPRTGTARFVGRLDGTLTAPSSLPAAAVAMGWVRRNAHTLGLDRRDLHTFHRSRDYVDIDGTHHLAWTQSVHGLEAFDNGLLASVTADGRLINVGGSPAHALGRGAANAPTIGHDQALARAGSPGAPVTGGRATLVYFHGGRSQLAWRTDTTAAPGQHVVSVIDATTGAVLWRADLTHDATGTGSAWGYFPSSKVPNGGGSQQPVTFPVNNGDRLAGNNAHVFIDARPDFRADPKDEVAAVAGLDWSSTAILDTTTDSQNCAPAHPCSWDYRDPSSWRQNLVQGATQAYYFVNTFHDHLLAAPIGFTEAAGNFQTSNSTGTGKGHDAVQVHAFFGASSGGGVPIPQYTNNASIDTPPDGRAPTLVLLLFRRDRFAPTFPSANPGDDASVVYHEYTHGLSGRLVTYPNGLSALNTRQSGAMGEAWSDWYALDFLVEQGYITDTAADGEVMMGKWITGGSGIRYQAIDCSVGASGGRCPGAYATGPGGFTFGDYGKVSRGPEVHSDGEIWAQTLWDLRDALGVTTARKLITRAMELSPPDPSFLDMRNAILQADLVADGGVNAGALWNVFRHRGMGYFASSEDGNDTAPTPDTHAPPSCAVDPCGSLGGHITDRVTGAPLANVRVSIGGHSAGFPGTDLVARTDANGRFVIKRVPFHTYHDVVVDRAGLDPTVRHDVRIRGAKRLDLRVFRDWAAADGGGRVASFTRPDYTAFGCGPAGAIDRSIGFGWSSDAPSSTAGSSATGPRSIVIRLPKAIDVASFGVAAGPTCGDSSGAAMRAFDIYTRVGASTPWRLALRRTTALRQGVLTTLAPSGTAVSARWVKLTMWSNRGDPYYMDMRELSVRGRPA